MCKGALPLLITSLARAVRRWHEGSGRARIATLCIITPAALLVGCAQQPKQAATRDEMREAWQHPGSTGTVAHPSSITVAQGLSPLVYQVRQTGRLHVSDSTTGTELASALVQPGTIIWVEEDKGIFANKQNLRPGPLPAGHPYSMSLDIEAADDWRAGVQAPRPAPLPATRPAEPPTIEKISRPGSL